MFIKKGYNSSPKQTYRLQLLPRPQVKVLMKTEASAATALIIIYAVIIL